jgi:ABC-type Fe3+-hydroxamate transport system substrate-binding protein
LRRTLFAGSGTVFTLILISGCGTDRPAPEGDTRAAVFGPSLAELFMEGGVWNRVAGVDSFTEWPPGADTLPRLGGYLDPSPEAVAALSPTSIHSVGDSGRLRELAEQMGIPYHSYSFDRLDDVLAVCDSLEALYPEASFDGFRERLGGVFARGEGRSRGSAALVVYMSDDGRFTLAGGGTFYNDLMLGMGFTLAAPESGTYPDVSVEGILLLNPDALIYLAPDHPDPGGLLRSQREFWGARGFPPEKVFLLDDDFILIPGARLPEIAERLESCLN